MKNTETTTVPTTEKLNETTTLPRDVREVSLAAAPTAPIQRGGYDEILQSSVPQDTMREIAALVGEAGRAEKIDEHGSWSFGAEFGKKRGQVSSLNWDLYGFGQDVHGGGLLAVIQIRQFNRRREGDFPQIRKNYFLLGRNEDGRAFAHSVSAHLVRAAARNDRDVVLAVQDWIFGGDYKAMIRQGDLALMPLSRRPSVPKVPERTALLEKSHRLKANIIRRDGDSIYAKNPHLVHIPGTHPEVKGGNRWYRIIVGERARFWRFAAPTVD